MIGQKMTTATLAVVLGIQSASAAFHLGLGQAVAKRSSDLINNAGNTQTLQQQGGGGGGLGGTSSRLLWHYEGEPVYYSSPALGSDGTIYVATTGHFVDFNGYWLQGQKPPAKPYGLYAYNPNGTLKWK